MPAETASESHTSEACVNSFVTAVLKFAIGLPCPSTMLPWVRSSKCFANSSRARILSQARILWIRSVWPSRAVLDRHFDRGDHGHVLGDEFVQRTRPP
jgi:hypothetical protein